MASEAELKQYLEVWEKELQEVMEKMGELSFKKYKEKKLDPELVQLEKRRMELLLNTELEGMVKYWLPLVSDKALQRKLEVLSDTILASKVMSHGEVSTLVRELDSMIVGYDYVVKGQLVDLGTVRNILKNEPDREVRKEAWLTSKNLSLQMEEKLLELVHLRNSLARDQGYANYADMSLALQGLQTEQVKEWLLDLTLKTNDLYQDLLTSGAKEQGLDSVQPWDVQYLLDSSGRSDSVFSRDKLLLALDQWCKQHGVDLRELGISVHFMDIPYNGLCMSIKRDDIRILGNPTNGYGYYKTIFHELGHSLHSAYNEQDSPVLRREAGVFSEGMAELFGYIMHEGKWLEELGLNSEGYEALQKSLLGSWFHYLRQRTAYALFEYSLYANPAQDLNQLMAKSEQDILGVAYDETARWAANAWYVSFPVYWQNYVIADFIASQVHGYLKNEFGGFTGYPEALSYLREKLLRPGASIDWQVKIKDATGRPLSADDLIADILNLKG